MTNADSCHALAAQAQADLGGLDVLVNNAALYDGLQRMKFEDIDEAV